MNKPGTQLVAILLPALLVVSARGDQERAAELPYPFQVKRAEAEAGNPLARYVELRAREAEYLASPQWRGIYPELMLVFAAFFGDPKAGPAAMEAMYRETKLPGPPESFTIDAYRPVDAARAVVDALDDRRVVMVCEEHHLPQTRTILGPLLRGLHERGFRYIAAETFSPDVSEAQKVGYPTSRTGTYTEDPAFGTAVREAIRLGYILVPYEAMSTPDVPLDQMAPHRERGQAVHLKERILDKDLKARALVWAGCGHVLKVTTKGSGPGELKMIAMHFRELTGIDPLSVYAAHYVEMNRPEHEAPNYRHVTSKGLVTRPAVFVGRDGALWSETKGIDAHVFFPRVTLVDGRPDWMARDLGRGPYRLPEGLLKGRGLRLAQASFEGEPGRAIPVDQVLLRPGEGPPALMLPPGKLRVRVIDEDGKVAGPEAVEIRDGPDRPGRKDQ
jgi:hypothetical protein